MDMEEHAPRSRFAFILQIARHSGVAEQTVDITAFVETFIDPKLKRGSKFRLHALGYLASQIADVAFQSGQHFILIRTQERFYENRCVAQIRGHADFSDADCMGAQHVVMHIAAHEDRSEEHTSELQSLMRISYAVFCLKKKKHKINI